MYSSIVITADLPKPSDTMNIICCSVYTCHAKKGKWREWAVRTEAQYYAVVSLSLIKIEFCGPLLVSVYIEYRWLRVCACASPIDYLGLLFDRGKIGKSSIIHYFYFGWNGNEAQRGEMKLLHLLCWKSMTMKSGIAAHTRRGIGQVTQLP